jgi:glycogen debranching enzyme
VTTSTAEAGFDINDAVVIKDENLFLVAARDGSIPLEGQHPFGLYYNDCRFLSGWQLEVMREPLRSLVASAHQGNSAVHELTSRELTIDGRRLPPQTLQVRVERDVTRGRILDERITVNNFAAEPLDAVVRVRLRGAFEPMMWIRGMAPEFTPKRPTVDPGRDGVRLSVTGHDGVERTLATQVRPRPARVTRGMFEWQLRLRRGRPQTLVLRHAVDEGSTHKLPGPPPLRKVKRNTDGAPSEATVIRSDDQLFNRILARSLADLSLLRSHLKRERYYAAGIPWYATVFGRDTLVTAMQMLAYNPRMAEETLRLLGRNLGTEVNDRRDEEPGKVLHEIRVGELANLGLLPFARYYGSVDSTPLFLCLMADHADWAGDLALFHEMAKEIDAALEWLDRWADLDGDGLIEYQRRTPEGLLNQGWKDSHDGVLDERGRPLRGPIALVEAQAYAVRAKRRIARLFELSGQEHRAQRLREDAIDLRSRLDAFWVEPEGVYSMALDGKKRASRALASNQGHVLWALAATPERVASVRDALMGPELFCGWGLRTLGENEPGYNPVGYHTGSVWPHDTALAAYGLRKYGFDEDFTVIFEGLLEAASRFPDYRLPELFAGFSRAQYDRPVPYPVACHPQAWAAGSIPYLVTVGLGLVPDGLTGRLRILRPSLPHWLGRIEVEGLRIAGAKLDLAFERSGAGVTITDVRIDGELDVVLEISANRGPELGL